MRVLYFYDVYIALAIRSIHVCTILGGRYLLRTYLLTNQANHQPERDFRFVL